MIIDLVPHNSPPRVDVSISGLDPTTERLTIVRIVDGEEWPVRLAGVILAGTGAFTEDHEAPTGAVLYYRVTAYNATGAVLEEQQTSVAALTDAPESWVWLSDPLDATSARLVLMTSETDRERTYPIPLSISHPRSSRYGTAAYSHAAYGRRQFGPGRWQIFCETGEEHDAVMALLAGSVLIRPQQWHRLGAQIYGVPDGLTAAVTGKAPGEQEYFSILTFEITPTRGPGVSVLVPRRTWADVLSEGATWNDINATTGGLYVSWRDVLRGQ